MLSIKRVFAYYQMYICLLTNLFVFDFLCCPFYRTAAFAVLFAANISTSLMNLRQNR